MQQQNPQDKKEHIPTKEKMAIISGCVLVALSVAVWGYMCVNGIRSFPYSTLVFCGYSFAFGIGIIWVTVLLSEYFKRAAFYAALFGSFMGAAWFYVIVGVRDNITTQAFGQFSDAFMAICIFLISGGVIFKTYLESLKRANKPIMDDVDYESNKRALTAIVGVAILIIASFAISYFFFPKGGEIFDESITLTKIVLFSVGIATFYWAAKANFIKTAHITEQIAEGKRRDRELAASQHRDTAQLIANASQLLGAKNDSEKFAGLAFLNEIAKDESGKFYQQAFDIILYFILYEEDKTTNNKPRIEAIKYIEPLYRKIEVYEKKEHKNIILKASSKSEILDNYFDLVMEYIGFKIIRFTDPDMNYPSTFRNCDFFEATIECIAPINCTFSFCKITNLTGAIVGVGYMFKYLDYENNVLKFNRCDFSDYKQSGSFSKIETKDCFYVVGHEPENIEQLGNLKVFQTSKEADDFFMGKSA